MTVLNPHGFTGPHTTEEAVPATLGQTLEIFDSTGSSGSDGQVLLAVGDGTTIWSTLVSPSNGIISPDGVTSSVFAQNNGLTESTTGSNGYSLTAGGSVITINSSGQYEFLGSNPSGGFTVFSATSTPNGFIEFAVNNDENTYEYFEEGYYDLVVQSSGTIEMSTGQGVYIADDSGTTIQMTNNNYMSLNSNWIELTIPGYYSGIDMQETSFTLYSPTGGTFTIQDTTGSTGTNGQVLTSNGSGNATWKTPSGGGGSPGGNSGTLQYNNGGTFAGDGRTQTYGNGQLSLGIDNGGGPGSGWIVYYDFNGNVTGRIGSALDGGVLEINTTIGGPPLPPAVPTPLNLVLSESLQLNGDPGSSGQVLTSNGSGSPPTWQAIPSDIRLKTNIKAITAGLDKINSLNPVIYTWKGERDDGKNHYGLIAQEVQQTLNGDVVSEATMYENKVAVQRLQLKYEEITAILIKAVQELSAQVVELSADIAQLKRK